MGKPSRQQPVVTTRRDGSLYSSQRAQAWDAKPNDPPVPTLRSVTLETKQADRRRWRLDKLIARRKRGGR